VVADAIRLRRDCISAAARDFLATLPITTLGRSVAATSQLRGSRNYYIESFRR